MFYVRPVEKYCQQKNEDKGDRSIIHFLNHFEQLFLKWAGDFCNIPPFLKGGF